MGWYVETGAERKTPDELVRELHEVVKPKLYAYVGMLMRTYVRLRRAKPHPSSLGWESIV